MSPERFEEGFDADPRQPGSMVTPAPSERGPSALTTPDESDRIAAELREAWVNGGFDALPEGLRGPTIFEIRAPEGGLSDRNAWTIIDQVRDKLDQHPLIAGGVRRAAPRNLPALGNDLPGSGEGTAALVQVGGQIFVGVNSGAMNDRWENLTPGRLVREQLDRASVRNPPEFHAETNALIRAYFRTEGALPSELKLYVDRDTCKGCLQILPAVLEAIGVDRLEIIMKSGEHKTILRRPGRK